MASSRVVNNVTAKCYTPSCIESRQVGDTDRLCPSRLFFAEDGRRSVCGKKAQRYAEDNRTEFNCRTYTAVNLKPQ